MADDEAKPLRKISVAFRDLAATVNSSETVDVEVAPFSRACSLVSPLFGCLGIAFKFAEMDYVAKVLPPPLNNPKSICLVAVKIELEEEEEI